MIYPDFLFSLGTLSMKSCFAVADDVGRLESGLSGLFSTPSSAWEEEA